MDKDVVMKDAEESALNNQNKKENSDLYLEFKKSLNLIDKSILIKDLKSLDINYRLINKFRRGFKEEDFSYLYELYIKNLYVFSSIKYDISMPKNFQIQPKLLNKTKDSPEIIGYIFLIILTNFIDKKNFEEAHHGIKYLLSYFKSIDNLTIKYLKAKTYYYYFFINEKLNSLDNIISEILNAYRQSCIEMDEITQVTLINCILRYYLLNNNIELAKSFLSKINFKENVSTNEDVRYLYYLGKIEAIQQNYSDAYIHLTNSFRKAPEKTAEDFKSLVTKNIIVVQLLMGEIPDVKNLLTQSQIKDFLIYKPYLELLKVVRHGNLEEFRNLLKLYEKSFENDGMFTLIQRIRHVLIKAGLRNINLSYSRISIKDIAEKLKLESEKEAEYIIAKAIRDGVFLAKINHEEGYVQSKEIKDIYSTFEPQRSYQSRIMFLNKVYNDAQQAMKYSEKQKEDKDIEKAELEEEDEMDRAFEDFQ